MMADATDGPPMKSGKAEPTNERARTAVSLAVLGGRIAREQFDGASGAVWKTDGSMLTQADLEIERRLEQEIAKRFPADVVLGEEGTGQELSRLEGRYWWVLDPIDGTNNFGRHMPGFCVSVGVLCDGVPVAGAVYDPLSDWLFTAWAGGGAWLNGSRINAPAAPLSPRSLFALRSPWPDGLPPFAQSWLARYRLRRFGSTALHLCYAALGGLAFVHDHGASLWDIAGAAIVLLEAGGSISYADGRPLFPIAPNVAKEPIAFLAGNCVAHRFALDDVRAAHQVAL